MKNQANTKTNPRKPTRILATSAAALLALCLLPTAAHAVTHAWLDGSFPVTDWSSAGNWTGGVPANGNDLEFSFHASGAGTRTSNNNAFLTSVNSILYQGQTFSLTGSAITLTGGITNNSTNIQTLGFATTGITLGAGQTWASNSGALVLNNAVALGGFQMTALADGTGHNITIAGIVSGTGLAAGAGIQVGSGATVGRLRLTNGANSYTAGAGGVGTLLDNGLLTVGATGALGASTLQIGSTGSAGTRTLSSDAGGVTIANTVTVRRDFSVAPTGTLTLSGAMTLNTTNQSTFTITQSNGAVAGPILDVTGAIGQAVGTANLVLDGANSHFKFSGAASNTYTGTTTLADGFLELNKTAALNAIAGDLFVGDGTGVAASAEVRLLVTNQIKDTSSVTVQSDGNFNLNTFAEQIANLTVNSGHVTGLPTVGNLFISNVLTMNGGTIDAAGGKLLLSAAGAGGVTATSATNPITSVAETAIINADVDLNAGAPQTFTVNAGTANIDLDLTGVISNGALTKVGTGVMQFSGVNANTYTGLTTVTAGTLLLNKDAFTGAISTGGLLINGGTVRNEQDAQIDDGATVTVNSGTYNVNGFSEFIGTLAGTGGTVNLGSFGDLEITNGSTNYGGNIIGSSFFKVFGGTQSLSGVNTYFGTTFITTATLKAASNTALSPNSNFTVAALGVLDLNGTSNTIGALNDNKATTGIVTNSSAVSAFLTIGNTNTNGTFAGTIRNGVGVVSLTKIGRGKQILTGNNIYTGNTWVNAGILQVDGRIASLNTFVNLGGTLMGTGVIGGNLFNGGVVSPGHSPGTLTVTGNYTQTPAGTLLIEVAGKGAGQHDLLAVGGAANLNGTVRILNVGSVRLKRGDKVTFLTAAGGVNGEFAHVNSDSFLTGGHLLKAGVVYDSNAVSLEAVQGSFVRDIGGLTPNQKAVAKNLDGVVWDSRANKLIDFLDQEPLGNLRNDLDKLAPEELVSVFNIGVSLANVQTANVTRRMDDLAAGSAGFSASGYAMGGSAYGGGSGDYSGATNYGARGPAGKGGKELRAPEDNRWGVFVTGVGEFTNIGNTSNARGYDLTTGGFTIGVDYRVTPNFVIGLNTGYARTSADLTDNGRVTVDGAKLGLYATYFTGTGFYADAAVSGGYNSYDTRRSALQGTAYGSTKGGEFNALFATGYDWKTGGLSIGPTASVQYTNVSLDSFREHGSLAPLNIANQSGESLRTALGMKASYDIHAGGVIIRPEVRAAWQHEFGDSSFALDSRFANGAGNTFTVRGPEIGEDSLLLGAGVAVLWNERTSTYVYYDGELARSNYSSNNVSGGVRMSF